jgi:ribokinase
MPQIGESLIGLRYTWIPGGKGANQAVALVRLGAHATLSGRVGNDKDGISLVGSLEQQGVLTDFVVKDKTDPTGMAVILLDTAKDNLIAVFPGANNDLNETDLQDAFASDRFDAVVMQLEVPDKVVIASCRLARSKEIPVFLDAGPARPFPLEELAELEVLSPNETEVLALTGTKVNSLRDAEIAAGTLLRRTHSKAVVIKLGSSGAFLRTQDGLAKHYPAFTVDAIDPTAAGDAFTAGLTIRYLETGDLEESVLYANAAGALAATKLGAQPSLPTALEVELFLEHSRRNQGTYV